MKKKIVLSIKPKYVDAIKNGVKKYEYRTKIVDGELEKIYIYETAPTMKVVGEVEVIDLYALPKKRLWELTRTESGITVEEYNKYFKNRKIAKAYRLGKVLIYDEPKDLEEFGLKAAPQSYAYVK